VGAVAMSFLSLWEVAAPLPVSDAELPRGSSLAGESSSRRPLAEDHYYLRIVADNGGSVPIVRAASDGSGISFGSTLAIPGSGGPETPSYLAERNGDPGSWSSFVD
jgi:hypothetical protein